MNGKPRRRRSYVASQRPDFNESLEKWAEYLRIDKNNPLSMAALAEWLTVQRTKNAASYK